MIFGDERDSAVRDKLLFSLDDGRERERLIRKSDEKLIHDFVVKVLNIAEKSGRLEASKQCDTKSEQIGTVREISEKKSGYGNKSGQPRMKCENCEKNHTKSQRCPASGTNCAKCDKPNH